MSLGCELCNLKAGRIDAVSHCGVMLCFKNMTGVAFSLSTLKKFRGTKEWYHLMKEGLGLFMHSFDFIHSHETLVL